jgi:hypothetical protein
MDQGLPGVALSLQCALFNISKVGNPSRPSLESLCQQKSNYNLTTCSVAPSVNINGREPVLNSEPLSRRADKSSTPLRIATIN